MDNNNRFTFILLSLSVSLAIHYLLMNHFEVVPPASKEKPKNQSLHLQFNSSQVPDLPSTESPGLGRTSAGSKPEPLQSQPKIGNTFNDYFQTIRRILETYFQYYHNQIPANTGEVHFEFALDQMGQVLAVNILNHANLKPSTNDLLLHLFRQASPFPAFPSYISEDQLLFYISIHF